MKQVRFGTVIGLVALGPIAWGQSKNIIKVSEVPVVTAQRLIVVDTNDAGQAVSNSATNVAPVTISNQALVQSPAVAPAFPQQPPTFVEATPLVESKADRMRRLRQQAELDTERKIVEKLEQSRIEDEARRADRLFGDRLAAEPTPPVAPTPVVVAPQPAPAPAPAPVPPAPIADRPEDRDELKSDIRSALREELKVQDALEPEKKKQGFYMSALLGLSEYPEAVNIDSKSSIGFTVGSTQDDLALEGAFIFSTYDLDRYTWDYKEIEQTSLQFAAKYLVPTGSLVRPVIGGVISYTMRTYADQLPFGGYYAWGGSENEVESSAIDMGVIAGVELEVSPRFAIGLDYRYMRNLTNQADSDYFRYLGFRNVEAVEEIDYQHISLIGRFTF